MFDKNIYVERRKKLKELVKSGVIYLPGNNETPMNFHSNAYHFRQDSTFLYYFGLDQAGLAAVIDVDNDNEIIFGDEVSLDDIVWMGDVEPISEQVKKVGVEETKLYSGLENELHQAISEGRKIHYLQQYKHDVMIEMNRLLDIHPSYVNKYTSMELTKAVIAQRSIKSDEEVAEIEKAVKISYEMNTLAMQMTKPGIKEQDVFGAVEGVSLSRGSGVSFPIIFSVNGAILHNHYHGNVMKDGDIALIDSGAETMMHYASDITRVIPVSGKFTAEQKDIYNIVLSAQKNAIEMLRPGVKFKDVHLTAAKIITEGLKDLGFMKGDVEDAVNNGAHALFFPHGLGHPMGLDVHDMEGLGENLVGYDNETKRDSQFGLAALRFGKKVEAGHVLTIEPGTYFIPQLIENWKKEGKNKDFLNFDKIESYVGFGGIRIEDDVLVTEDGYKVLGPAIPKEIEDVEETCNL